MKTYISLILITLLPFTLLAQLAPFSLKGKLGSLDRPAKVYLHYKSGEKSIIDSCILKQGEFVFSGKVDGPVHAILGLNISGKGLDESKYADSNIYVYLEKGNMTAESSGPLDSLIIHGSRVNDENRKYMALIAEVDAERERLINKIRVRLPARVKADTLYINMIQDTLTTVVKSSQVIIKKYIGSHPSSFISLMAIMDIYAGVPAEEVFPVLNTLSKEILNTAVARDYRKDLLVIAKVGVGFPAPDFTLKDINEKPVSLFSFKGKYVLLDFWASWCAPCRAENPNVASAYEKLKDKNFTVVSVSIDVPSAKSKWLQAIKKDHMPWTNLAYMNGNENPVSKLYSITTIPQNFLISPDGKIIARNLSGEDMASQIASFMKSK